MKHPPYVIIAFGIRGSVFMSPGMLKMWISIAGMGLMFLAISTIYLSRYKLKGVLKFVICVPCLHFFNYFRHHVVYCSFYIIIEKIGDCMNWKVIGTLLVVTTLFLTGCMYPSGKLAENQIPYTDQIQAVQQAVNTFKEDNGGILPIKTRDAVTPIYQKYPIEFKKIAPKYLAEPPGNAFESGGIFQYVLVDVETNPTVKLLDLRMADIIRDIKLRIKSNGYPPYKEKLADNVYTY